MEVWGSKVVCLLLLLLLSLAFGLLPLVVVRKLQRAGIQQRGRIVLSHLNCFSGGVFLATSFLHLLPEVKEKMAAVLQRAGWGDGGFPVTEAVVCGGFYVIMLLEHAIMTLRQRGQRRRAMSGGDHVTAASNIRHMTWRECSEDSNHVVRGERSGSHGDAVSERTALLGSRSREEAKELSHRKQQLDDDVIVLPHCDSDVIIGAECENQPPHHHHGDSHQETSQLHGIRSLVLWLALSLHTVFEGLALGLQTSTASVWTLLIALSVHKVVIAFTLGLQLTETLHSKKKVTILIVSFSLVAPLGVGIGTAITANQAPSLAIDTASAILQGIATGTFLYVTFFEVLQTEMGNDHSISRVLCAILGSLCIAGLNFLEDGESDTVTDPTNVTIFPVTSSVT